MEGSMYWDESLYLVEGCAKVGPGCAHCWSERIAPFRLKKHRPYIFAEVYCEGEWSGRSVCRPELLEKVRGARKPRIYSIWNDLFHKGVPDSFICDVFAVMTEAQKHTFLILTKRPERMLQWSDNWLYTALPNVWLGTTAVDQETADERIHYLLKTPAAVRFVSVEPMLGEVNLTPYLSPRWIDPLEHDFAKVSPGLDWVICGGESGPAARPMNPEWVRNLRDQCIEAGTPFYMKQWGNWKPYRSGDWGSHYHWFDRLAPTGEPDMVRVRKEVAGRTLDGREWNESP
jgi:protein gp37